MSNTELIDRRTLFRQAAELIAGASAATLAKEARAQNQPGGPAHLFPSFKASIVQTSGATINVASGGQGPPLLPLHGAPQSHVSWRLVAPKLAADYTVIVGDAAGQTMQASVHCQ